ncbi:hypothetical protein [Hamadaea tsunoensis]|uniref:hypothetical protein n=1 Tax=Hamadaea tsunoensis TaxID=53368 RepID=UPI000402924F|nr:hypothetical protein [Hamadaea tsunoensis]
MRRLAPAFALYFLAPFVAEFLLGDFPVTMIFLILPFSLMYGGGALLIREVTRRAGRGWPTMALLALAYGVLEEGLTTQSLFNPNYVDAHLLDQGFVPALGIAVPWTIFVLAIHVIWSISTPIAIVEESTRDRREQPWLRTPGLVVTAVLFLLGTVFTFAVSYGDGHFMATPAQLIASVVAVVALVVAAFALPRRRPAAGTGGVPGAWVVFGLTLATGIVFFAAQALPTWPGVAVMALSLVLAVVGTALWSARAGWGRWHRFAVAAGSLLTYTWHSFLMHPIGEATAVVNLVSHIIFAVVAVLILWYAYRRTSRPLSAPVPAAPAEVVPAA